MLIGEKDWMILQNNNTISVSKELKRELQTVETKVLRSVKGIKNMIRNDMVRMVQERREIRVWKTMGLQERTKEKWSAVVTLTLEEISYETRKT